MTTRTKDYFTDRQMTPVFRVLENISQSGEWSGRKQNIAQGYLFGPVHAVEEEEETAFEGFEPGQTVRSFRREMFSYAQSLNALLMLTARLATELSHLVSNVAEFREAYEQTYLSKNILISNIFSTTLRLRQPLSVTVQENGGIVTAYSSDLEIFGEGETEPEAVHDFCETLSELYFKLRDHKKTLSPYLEKIFFFMQGIIEEIT